MEIDIRDNVDGKIDKIRFSDADWITKESEDLGIIEIKTNSGFGTAEIFTADIGNLIKALQKAKEIWDAEEGGGGDFIETFDNHQQTL